MCGNGGKAKHDDRQNERMPSPRTTRPRTGRPPVTSRTQIMTAARRLIDRDGWEKLTLRRLAAELGIGTTTLYHHVRDKEDLMVLLSPTTPNEYRVPNCRTTPENASSWPPPRSTTPLRNFPGPRRC